jgi:hypothetical protein
MARTKMKTESPSTLTYIFSVPARREQPHFAIIEVNVELPPCIADHGFIYEHGLTANDEALARRLGAVPGVERVKTSRYAVEITKGRVFGWDDVRRGILDVLCEHFGTEGAPRVFTKEEEDALAGQAGTIQGIEFTVGAPKSGGDSSGPEITI